MPRTEPPPPADKSKVRIRRFHHGKNIHAKLAGFDVNMRNIGGIEVGQGQSPHMGDLNLSTEIAMGSVSVPYRGRSYEWSLSGASIVLDVFNASVIPGSYYRDYWQDAELAVETKGSNHDSRNTGYQADAAVVAEAGWKGLLCLKFLAAGKAAAKRDGAHQQTTDAQITRTPALPKVERTGDGILWAGDSAEARKLFGVRELRGIIVSPYGPALDASGNKTSADNEVPTPLARLVADDPTKAVYGMITVRAVREAFILTPPNGNDDVANPLLDALKRDKAEMLRRQFLAENELRRRVAALAALKKPKDEDRNRPGGEEIDLFSCVFCFEPDQIDTVDDGERTR